MERKNEEKRAYDHIERIDVLTKESGGQNKRTYTNPQPATPVSSPHDREVFANKSPRDMGTMDGNYAIYGSMSGISERTTFALSANSSQFLSETTRTPDHMWSTPRHSDSPSFSARTARMLNTDGSQNCNTGMRLMDEERAGYMQ